jgi:hypothetical protein
MHLTKGIRKNIFAAVTALSLCGLAGCTSASDPGVAEVAKMDNAGVSADDIIEETTMAEPTPTQPEQEYSLEEMEFYRDGMKIYGRLYIPAGEGPFPVAIMGHGLGQNLALMDVYAKDFVKEGIAAYTFDFIGGGNTVRSDGKMTEMSVLTEAADFNVVFDGIRSLDVIDQDNVFVMGGSQGGFVATYIAGTRPEEVKGLIALYPAYILQENARERTKDGTQFYDTFNLLGMTLGRQYDEDLLSFDIYEVMKNYEGEVLLLQGTKDALVPTADSERAAETFSSAELVMIEGGGHGFIGNAQIEASQCAIEFIKKVANMN